MAAFEKRVTRPEVASYVNSLGCNSELFRCPTCPIAPWLVKWWPSTSSSASQLAV